VSSLQRRPPLPLPASEPPLWALEWCPGCARYTALAIFELACCCPCAQCCHDHKRNLVALAWVCDRCDRVLDSVGLYTSWAAAQDARRRTLKGRELDGTTLWRGLGRES
jgi:hypothetical protein